MTHTLHTPPTFAPDFFVVGAAKAGTTAVYHWLAAHPDVFLPAVKEPGYFAYADRPAAPRKGLYDPGYVDRIVTDVASYAALYADADKRLTGDVSPVYLLDENAAARIAAQQPRARIVIVLRDPVDRAFSQYMHHMRDSLETCPRFEDALAAEQDRLQEGWSWGHGYATHGHYAAQIARYLAVFPRDQILFLEYRDLQSAPDLCWHRLCWHLGLEQRPMLRNDRVNATADLAQIASRPGLARRLRHPSVLQQLLKRAIPAGLRARIRPYLEGRGKPVPVLSDATRQTLAARYRAERPRVETLTGLCLSHWG